MDLRQKKIQSLIKLGDWLKHFSTNKTTINLQKKLKNNNGWFTKWNLDTASLSWGKSLNFEDIMLWLENHSTTKHPKKVGLILAGNIPFVGLHDILSVWFSGHMALVKLSRKDMFLLPFVICFLEKECPETKGQIIFSEKKFKDYDAVIATGSDNSSRYFDFYFKKTPNIIRKNRNGIAVLDGNETKSQIELLGYDILAHYGLGCRNVSKLFIPKNYDLDIVFGGLYKYSSVMGSAKYANNYDYNKAVFLMSEFDFKDNGFFMLKNDSRLSSPLTSAFYSEYDSIEALNETIRDHIDEIQCVVSNQIIKKSISFGEAQNPKIYEYADGINTLDFLEKL